MAKDEEIDFDNFDIDDMDDDFGLGEGQSNKPTTAREAAVNSLKDGVSGFTEEIVGDPLGTAVEMAEKSLPNSVRSEVMEVKDVATTLRDEVKQATMDIRRAGTGTLKSISSMMPDNSGMKSLLDKVVNFVGPDDSYDQQQEQINAEQRQNLEIQSGILEALGNITPDARQVALKEQMELNRSKSHQELMATSVSNSQKLLDFTYSVTNSYYRKSLELQYKHYYTSREQLGLLKTSLETFKNQFENIIKNTALPEIVKIRTSEQLKENMAARTREAITDVVYNELNPLKTFKEKATNKIRSVKDDFVEGFSNADDIVDSASMLQDMEEMGFTKSKIAGSFLGGGLKSYIGNKVGDKIEDNKGFKEAAFNFKNAVNNPSGYITDKAKDIGDKDFFGSSTISNTLYGLSDMFKQDDPRTLATFKKDDPEAAAIFNFRVQNSITTVIPNLLSKIYGEVKSFRTGDDNPEGNEIRWNDGKDKFETMGEISANIKSSIKKTVSDKMGYNLTKMMDKIDPKKELSNDESGEVLASLVKYLQETKDTTPIGLVKGKNSFLNYLPKELQPKVQKQLGSMVGKAKDDHYEYSDLNYTLKSLTQSIPNLVKEATTLYKTGNKAVLEELGVMVTDDVSNTSYVDRNGIFKFVNQNIKDHGSQGFKDDMLRTESMARYTGNKTQAELDALRKKEYKKKVKPVRSLEEVLEENTVNSEMKNQRYKKKNDFKQEFDTQVDNITGEAKKVYEDSIGNNVNKVKTKVDKAKDTVTNNKVFKEAEEVVEKGKGTFNKVKRKAKAYSKVGKKKLDTIVKSKTVTKIKDKAEKKLEDIKANETYIETMATIDSKLDMFTKEYLTEEAKLDKLFKDNNIDVSVQELRGKINKDGLTKLYEDTTTKLNNTFKSSKTKAEETYNSLKDKSTKEIVESAKTKGTSLFGDMKEIISDAVKGKISVKTSNSPLSGMEQINHSDVTKVKGFSTTKEGAEAKHIEYKDMDSKTENTLREMYFKSEAYILGRARSFGDYVKTFGYKPKSEDLSRNTLVEGLTKLSKEEADKQTKEFKEKLLDNIKLKKLSKDDDDAMRFEFYNSPEYKAGSIKDYGKWLRDKGYRSHYTPPLISIKSILKKTRQFDRWVFSNLVGKPMKALAKAPFKAAIGLGKAALHPIKTAKSIYNGTSTVGKIFKPVANMGMYALDGAASAIGLGFYGVNDNKLIAKLKDRIKYRGMSQDEIDYLKERDTTLFDKGLGKVRELGRGKVGKVGKGIGSGIAGAGRLGFKAATGIGKFGLGIANAINPFRTGTNEPTKAEILKKFRDKQPNPQQPTPKAEDKKTSVLGKIKNVVNKVKGVKQEHTVPEPPRTQHVQQDHRDLLPKEEKPKTTKTSILSKIKNVAKKVLKPKEVPEESQEVEKPKTKARAKVKETKSKEPAYNDRDGSGRRDGSWLDKLDEMKAAKEKAKSNNPQQPTPKAEDKKTSMFDLLKNAVGILGSIGGIGATIATGVLAIKPLLSLISGGIGSVISAVTGGFGMLTKVPELLGSIGTKIGTAFESMGKLVSSGFSAIKGMASTATEVISSGVSKVKEMGSKVVNAGKSMIAKVTPDSIKAFYNRIKDMIFKKLGKKAGGKVALTLAGKIASRAVPIAGLAILAYDVAMVTKDMLENNTDFGSAVSKQLLGFDIFSDTEPALDEDGKPIQPDEEISSDDLAKQQGIDKEKEFDNKSTEEKSEEDKPGFFSKLKDSVVSSGKSAYESGKGVLSSAYEGVKKGITTAVDYGKQALGGLVGSIPFPNGNGSWAALKDTIVGAAKAVGVDEKLMGVMGAIESGFNYKAKADEGSASGIFQFIDKTWKAMINKYGSKYGIPKDTPQTEPRTNALMGAEYLKENMSSLKGVVNGRDVNYTDAYMAHFLGAGGAKKFITAMNKDPGQSAASIFSEEANSNKSIFYVNKDTSKPRSLGDVYNLFTNKINEKAKSFGIGDVGAGSGGASAVPSTTSNPTADIGGGSSSSSPSTAPVATPNTSSSPTTTSSPTVTSSTPSAPVNTAPMSQPVEQPQVVSKPENNNSKVLEEGNSLLKGISTTLGSSLEVQMQMAKSLEALTTLLGNKPLGGKLEDVSKKVNSTYKTQPQGPGYNMPEPVVNLDKKNY